ncbi:uncharacterized protein LOC144362706 [Saccoglossus kowalevskii]
MSLNISSHHRYLLPIFFYNSGPCGQFRFFKTGIAAAIYLNRSIVTIPFHNNHLFNVSKKRSIDETFDLTKLRTIVDFATPDEFLSECGRHFKPENVLLGPYFVTLADSVTLKSYSTARSFFQRVMNINLPESDDVVKYQDNLGKKRANSSPVEVSSKVRCIIYLAQSTFGDKFEQAKCDRKIAGSFARAPYVRHAADIAVQQISDWSPYAVIHWRNKSGEICLNPSSHLCNGSKWQDDLKITNKYSDVIAEAIKKSLKDQNITILYVAAPPYPHVSKTVLNRSFSVHFKIPRYA